MEQTTWAGTIYFFELLRWESISAGFGSDGQEVINTEVGNDYDLLIALFWARLGSATPRAASGTVEEYERALERFKAGEAIEIGFFFKDAPIDFRASDLDQAASVKKFEKAVQEAGALTKTFRDLEGLKFEIALLLDRVARRQLAASSMSTSAPSRNFEASAKPALKKGSTNEIEVSSPNEDEVGILDAAEHLQEHAASATEFLSGFIDLLQSMTKVTNEVNEEYDQIRKLRPLEIGETKSGLEKVASSMDSFSEFLESNNAEYRENTFLIASDIRDIVRASYDFTASADALSSTVPFQAQIVSMAAIMIESTDKLDGMVATISGMPRTTSRFNKARRRLLQNLSVYRDSTLSSHGSIELALAEFAIFVVVQGVSGFVFC